MASATALFVISGCETPQPPAPPNTLVAAKVAAAPNLAALAGDAAWARAQPLSFRIGDGVNFADGKGATDVTLKAVYTADMLYMLIQYKDPTNSVRRGPYQKQADGSWLQLKDPANKGGDDNVYYEDKWAFLWPASEVRNFDKQGCTVACHLGEGKPYGNKYTRSEGEILDMWHMKGMRTAPMGFVDDQYTDHTRYDAQKSPNAGRKGDPGGAEYNAFPLENGKPKFMNKDGKAANAGGTYFIRRGDEVAFDDSRFKPGDEVAAHISNVLQGDRADVRIATAWKDGVHTAVISRKLVTGSKFDVQWNDLSKRYAFGFAAFDNAQVRHATSDEPMFLVFGK
ncbi:MAG TPA: ethylbenzene dehydrogenase-related protein [Burkholderiaceae bacterium]|nr:ethylbenzene dehydrogenase-related protein [Burkholderiaceae bacterium]